MGLSVYNFPKKSSPSWHRSWYVGPLSFMEMMWLQVTLRAPWNEPFVPMLTLGPFAAQLCTFGFVPYRIYTVMTGSAQSICLTTYSHLFLSCSTENFSFWYS